MLGKKTHSAALRWGPIVLAAIASILAVLYAARVLVHLKDPEITPVYLFTIAVVALLLPKLAELTVGKDGITFKTRVEDLEQKVESIGETAKTAEANVIRSLPQVAPRATPIATEVAKGTGANAAKSADPSDPHAGRFGNKAEANGRKLTAEVVETDNPDWFRVKLKVAATSPEKPLTDEVKIHLHPTFKPDTITVLPVDNIARARFYAYGAFTVGAETDSGNTRLELNLSKLRGVPRVFRLR